MKIKKIQTKGNINEITNDLVSKCRRISNHFLEKDEKGQKYSVNGLEKFKEMLYTTILQEYASKLGFGKDKFNYSLADELRYHAQFYDSLINKVKKEKFIKRDFNYQDPLSEDKHSSTQHIFIDPQPSEQVFPFNCPINRVEDILCSRPISHSIQTTLFNDGGNKD